MPIRFELTRQFFDANGNPLAGGLVYFYVTNTTTPKDTYSNTGLSIANDNPIELDSGGYLPVPVFMTTGDYKVVITDADGGNVDTYDPISGKDVSLLPSVSVGDANKVNVVNPTGTGYSLVDTIREQKIFATQSGGNIIRVLDDGATSNTDSQTYIDFNWASSIGGAVTRLGYVGKANATNSDIYLLADSGNIRISAQSTSFIIMNRPLQTSSISFDNGTTTLGTYAVAQSWTPVPRGSSTAGSPTGTFTGVYTKIGRLVFATCQLVFTSLSTMAGNFIVGGLPFTVAANSNNRAGISVSLRHNWTNDVPIIGYTSENTTDILFYQADTDLDAIVIGDMSATTNLYFSVVYLASS